MAFAKGNKLGGRPKACAGVLGQLRKLRDVARKDAERVMRRLAQIALDPESKTGDAISAGRAVLEWSYGRPENAVEVVGGPQDYAELPPDQQAEHMRTALKLLEQKLAQAESEKGTAA